MRRTVKGAAALAALCAGALAFAPVATAADSKIPGASGALNAEVARVAGTDRIQTAIEAASNVETPNGIKRFFLVGYNSQVDALTLAAWNCKTGDKGYVLYVKDGLEKRTLEILKKHDKAEIYIIGGTKAVSAKVEEQLNALNGGDTPVLHNSLITRLAGVDRYDTAYQVGGLTLGHCFGYSNALDLKVSWDKQQTIIDSYMEAMKAYELASDNLNKAEAKVAEAEKALDKALMAFQEAVKAIVPEDQLDKELEKFFNSNVSMAHKLAQANADLKVVFDGLQTVLFNKQGVLVTNQTVQMFLDAPEKNPILGKITLSAEAKKAQAILKKIIASADTGMYGNIKATDTMETAIQKAKSQIDLNRAAILDADTGVGGAIKGRYLFDKAVASNKANQERVAKLYMAVEEAAHALEEAKEEAQTATDEWTDALEAVNALTPTYLFAKQHIAKFQAEYRAGLDAAYQLSAKPIFLASGLSFADSLVAGPAAQNQSGVILLTQDSTIPAITKKALDLSKAPTVAIGGPAVSAVKTDKSQSAALVYGKDRYATSVEVAKRYFSDKSKKIFALASGVLPADAVIAGTYLTAIDKGAGVLLTAPNALPRSVADYLSFGTHGQLQAKSFLDGLAIFGGKTAVSDDVMVAAAKAAHLQ